MTNIIYIGERRRALRLVEGLLSAGFDIQLQTAGEAATVGTIREEEVGPASRRISSILDGLYTGVQK